MKAVRNALLLPGFRANGSSLTRGGRFYGKAWNVPQLPRRNHPPVRTRRGRPPKFNRPARPVTVTLPEDVLETLRSIDPDVGRAIVRLSMRQRSRPALSGIEVAASGGRAVIVVHPTRALSSIAGVELVPLADGRALISLEDGMPEAQFEIEVRDALESAALTEADREMLRALAALLRQARRSHSVTFRRILVLRAKR